MYALYGKLPATGDFVSRGFPREAIDELDVWFASGLIDKTPEWAGLSA